MAEEDEQGTDDTAEKAGGGKKKLIILIVLGVLLLAGAGGGTLYFLGFFDGEDPLEEGAEQAIEENVVEKPPSARGSCGSWISPPGVYCSTARTAGWWIWRR